MQITIAERLLPFSNQPGTTVLLPGTSLSLKIYPARIEFKDLSTFSQSSQTVDLPISGPVDDFTVQLDLEKGRIIVWGTAKDGFFRYYITAFPEFSLIVEKGKMKLHVPKPTFVSLSTLPHTERLSFGCHKKQDWSQVVRRSAMEEIFPFWYRLAQLVPPQKPAIYEGTASLLPACCKAIVAKDKNNMLHPFKTLFHAGFEGILSPRLTDDDHSGLSLHPIHSKEISPLQHLVEGALLIRSMLVQSKDSTLHILPALPTEFHSGRFINVLIPNIGMLSMEWSKKAIKKVHLTAHTTAEVTFQFDKSLQTFRMNRSRQLPVDQPISIQKDRTYILDRFC